MQVTKNQLNEFNAQKLENFITLSISFLNLNFQKWCDGKEVTELRKFIISMIDLGKTYNINKGNDLQKLMHYKIEFGFEIPLHKKLEQYLTEPGLNESSRLENFHLALLSGRYRLTEICLDEKARYI